MMIGQHKRGLEECISLQPSKYLKQDELVNEQEELNEEVVDDGSEDNHTPLKVRFEEHCKELPDLENKDNNSSSQEHSSLELSFPIHESSASSPAPNRFFHPISLDTLLPRKRVPVGPDYQAEVPTWEESQELRNTEEEGKWCSSRVWPLTEGLEGSLTSSVGRGRKECRCEDSGFIDCVKTHIEEERERLAMELGQAFNLSGFDDMGECVAELWTEEEERAFKEVVKLNPASEGRNFWLHLRVAFPTRTVEELVSYYFNVFMLRRRAIQNRVDPMNIDSDDDEGDLPDGSDGEEWDRTDNEDEESVEFEVHRPFYGDEGDLGEFEGIRERRIHFEDDEDDEQEVEDGEALPLFHVSQENEACPHNSPVEKREAYEDDGDWSLSLRADGLRDRQRVGRLEVNLRFEEAAEGVDGDLGEFKGKVGHEEGAHEKVHETETESWIEWDKLGASSEFFGEGGDECRNSGIRGVEKVAVEDVCS